MNYSRRKVIVSLRNQPNIIRDVIQDNVKTIDRMLNENLNKCTLSDQSRRTPLHLAASLGRTEIVDLFLQKECYTVNYRDNDLVTPLHRACRNNHPETVAKLLQYKADVNARSRLHITPLHVCSAFDALECARIIVEAVSNINATDSNGTTALHYAVFKNNLPLIELLLAYGAQPDVQDKYGQRPIHYAAISNCSQAIQLLVQAGSDVNVRNKDLLTPLHFAIAHKSQEAFFELLKVEANLEAQDIHGNMPSHWAAFMGCEAIFDEILKRVRVTSPNLEGITPLHFACYSDNSHSLAVKIMDSIADVDITDKYTRTPLHFAALNGREEIANELIARGANCNYCDIDLETPLHKATQNCHIKMNSLLIRNGAQVDTANKDGFTPLHFAVMAGLPWNCDSLIKSGANPLLWDNSGRTPHYLAVYKGSFDCLLCLMVSQHYLQPLSEGNGDQNVLAFPPLDGLKRSLLHYATASNTCSHDLIEILLLRRPLSTVCNLPSEVIPIFENAFRQFDINQQDIYGRTPLHYVCLREIDVESDIAFLVELLLEFGADISIVDNDKRLPLHYAVVNGYNTILEALFKPKWMTNRADYSNYFSGCCPLKAAAYYGNCSAISILINFGFRSFEPAIEIATRRSNWNCVIKLKSYVPRRSLFQKLANISVYNGHSNGLRIFLSCHNTMDLDNLFFLAAASASGASCLEMLLEKHINIQARNRHGRNALFFAVMGGCLDSVKLLLASGIRIVKDTNGKSVFHLIAANGNLDMFKLFHSLSKENGFSGHMFTFLITKDNDGFCPIEVACVKGHQSILEYYLTNINQGFEQKLMYFAGFVANHVYVEYLLNKNSSTFIHFMGPQNRTLLHYCCMSKQPNQPLLKLLIQELKFNVHALDRYDLTPLLCATSVGNPSTVEYLLANTDSNPMITDSKGNTALHLACLSGNSDCALAVIRLTEKSMLSELINAENSYKQTALHLASLKSLKPVIIDLLSNGAEVLEEDNFGYIPSMYCARDPVAAACLKMIESIMELEISSQLKAQEQQTEQMDDSLISTASNSCLAGRPSQPSGRSSIFRQSLPEYGTLIESRMRSLSRGSSLPPSSCDNDFTRFPSKNSLKDVPNKIEESIETSDSGQDTLVEGHSDQQNLPNDLVKSCPEMKDSNADNLVDSDSDMY